MFTAPSNVTDDFIEGIPKVELHLHLVGALALSAIRRKVDRGPESNLRELSGILAGKVSYRDSLDFGKTYRAVNDLFRTANDFSDAVLALAHELSRHGVRYAEVAVTPINHLFAGVREADLLGGLEEGRLRALEVTGIPIRWCFAASGRYSVDEGFAALDLAVSAGPSVVSFGLGGPEVPRKPFGDLFRAAREHGFHVVPHAGETEGAASVWSALVDLGAERIGHGIGSVEDPNLLEYLASSGVALEVCPSSNIATGVVQRWVDHPVIALIEDGVMVTINSDDPVLFGTNLSLEYRRLCDIFGIDAKTVAMLAENGVSASFMQAFEKDRILGEIRDYVGLWESSTKREI